MDRSLIEKVLLVTGGALIGGGTTYLLLDKVNKRKYRDIAEAEIQDVKETFRLLKGKGEPADDREELRAYLNKLDELQDYSDQVNGLDYAMEGGDDVKNDIPETPIKLEGDQRIPPRSEDGKPYVITINEFFEDEQEFEKITITYYEKDNTLVDEREQMIDDVERVIGLDSLNYFGWNSGSESVVHVRNPKHGADFEVLQDPQSYSETVLGIPSEIPDRSVRGNG